MDLFRFVITIKKMVNDRKIEVGASRSFVNYGRPMVLLAGLPATTMSFLEMSGHFQVCSQVQEGGVDVGYSNSRHYLYKPQCHETNRCRLARECHTSYNTPLLFIKTFPCVVKY